MNAVIRPSYGGGQGLARRAAVSVSPGVAMQCPSPAGLATQLPRTLEGLHPQNRLPHRPPPPATAPGGAGLAIPAHSGPGLFIIAASEVAHNPLGQQSERRHRQLKMIYWGAAAVPGRAGESCGWRDMLLRSPGRNSTPIESGIVTSSRPAGSTGRPSL